MKGTAALRADSVGRGTKDYRAFMRASDATSVLDVVEACFTSWLGEKGLEAGEADDRWVAPGSSAWLQRAHDGIHGLLRAQLVESQTGNGTWTTDVIASAAGWIQLVVANSERRMVAVPRFAKSLMGALDLKDASLQLKNDVKLWDVGEVDLLVDLLQDRDRHGLVLVAGTGPDPNLFEAFRDRIPKWTREVYGLAQSIVLTPQATWALGERLSFHAVAPWTVRTYYPGLDPGSAVDSRRHRFLSTATLANENDARLRSLLANVARLQASQRPEPLEAVLARRVLERQETEQLVEQLQQTPAVEPPVATAPTRARQQQPIVAEAPEAPTVDAIAVASPVLDLLSERLGLEEVTEQTVDAALQGLLSARGDLHQQVRRASLRIKEQSARLEELEDELRLSAEYLDDDALEQAMLQQELDGARAESRWLRERLRELQDFEGAAGVPEGLETDYPTSCREVIERLLQAPDGVVIFTGDLDEVAAVDEVDVLQLAARTAWDACHSMNEYARARAAGDCSNGVDHFLKNRPAGYEGISPGKHAQTETGVTMRRFGAERRFPVPESVEPTGFKVMTAHFKLARLGMFSPRLYYFDDLHSTGKIYVGYLGRHLTNTQTN